MAELDLRHVSDAEEQNYKSSEQAREGHIQGDALKDWDERASDIIGVVK